MAKSLKPRKPNLKKFKSASLVAAAAPNSMPADVTFTFTAGIGQATATLFRHGVLINMQSISSSGIIHFSEVQTGDVISVNGVCTGNANIRINVPTSPATPKNFTAGIILAGFLIK